MGSSGSVANEKDPRMECKSELENLAHSLLRVKKVGDILRKISEHDFTKKCSQPRARDSGIWIDGPEVATAPSNPADESGSSQHQPVVDPSLAVAAFGPVATRGPVASPGPGSNRGPVA